MANDVTVDTAAVQRLADGPESPVGRYLRRLADEVAQRAREAVPVRSRRLQDSIGVAPLSGTPFGYAAGSDLAYTLFIERRSGFLSGALRETIT